MMAGWDGGEGMVPERRQEHVPYFTHYLTWQRSILTT